jgi:hypothetical protein
MAIKTLRKEENVIKDKSSTTSANSDGELATYKQSLGSNPPTFALTALPSNTNSPTNLPVAGPF